MTSEGRLGNVAVGQAFTSICSSERGPDDPHSTGARLPKQLVHEHFGRADPWRLRQGRISRQELSIRARQLSGDPESMRTADLSC